jgi:DNA modification methylase
VSTGQTGEVTSGVSRCSDVFAAPVGGIESGLDHPAMFPVSLAEQLVLTFSREEDLVCDPFMGSGSSLVAAKRLGRDFCGFDVNKRYVKIALGRLASVETCR